MLCNTEFLWLGICTLLIFTNSIAVAELKFVNLLWRHGARSPLHFFPNDPYKISDKSIWPQGSGQLTRIGMQQHYELGIFLRQRYGNLLSAQYNHSEIYVRSSDIDRTLQSAQCNLAGLYGLSGIEKWNYSVFSWEPIPVHTVPIENDYLLFFPPNEKYSEIREKIGKCSMMTNLINKYKGFIQEIKNLSGMIGDLDLSIVYHVYDSLVCEKAANLSLPDWVTAGRWKNIYELSVRNMGFDFGMNTSYRIPVAKLRGGILMKRILENMKNHINGSQPYKVFAYSAHDTTLSGVLTAANVFNSAYFPTFASCLMFELHENGPSNGTRYFVKTFYRLPMSNMFVQLRIFGCDLECPLSELENRAQTVLSDAPLPSSDIDEIKGKLSITTNAFYAVSTALLLTLLVMVIKAFHRRKADRGIRHDSVYQPLTSFEDDA